MTMVPYFDEEWEWLDLNKFERYADTSHAKGVMQWFPTFLAWGHSYFVEGRQRPKKFLNLADTIYMTF